MTDLAQAQELFFSALAIQKDGDFSGAEILYRKALVLAPDRPSILNNLAAVLQLQGKHAESLSCSKRLLDMNERDASAWMNRGNAEAGLKLLPQALASYDRALEIAPDYADALVNRASALALSHRQGEALDDLQRALEIVPDHAEARINRAGVLVDLHRSEEALADYQRCLEHEPENAKILSSLGNALLEAGKVQEALAACERAIALDPGYADAFQNRGNALRDLRRYPEALQDYARAQALAPAQPGAYWNEALCRLLVGDFEHGWTHYARGWDAGQRGRHPSFAQPAWNGAYVDGTLLAWGEQGIGDQILHCGMLDRLRAFARHLVVAVDPRLIPLFKRSFADIEFVSLADLGKTAGFAAQVALGDLGACFRRQPEHFPGNRNAYLCADSTRAGKLRQRLKGDGKFRCGISWRSANSRLGKFKSLALADFADVISIPGVQCVDLQYGDTGEERLALKKSRGLEVIHVDDIDNFRDIDGFAALIDACDMVVSVSNTTVHLAGALGKPTAVLLPYAQGRIWYWHEGGETSPWYPACRLYRQPAIGEWGQVMTAVAAAVRRASAEAC
jgi:tetratricopeptide (TPR) repeat protein